jgi:hypothetical protein
MKGIVYCVCLFVAGVFAVCLLVLNVHIHTAYPDMTETQLLLAFWKPEVTLMVLTLAAIWSLEWADREWR